jgi:hypothetical protein
MPLDLHVLSLSLAFILSQDQTLRCIICLFLYPWHFRVVSSWRFGFTHLFLSCTTVVWKMYQRSLLVLIQTDTSRAPFVWKAGAKVEPFSSTSKLFNQKISSFFWPNTQKTDNRHFSAAFIFIFLLWFITNHTWCYNEHGCRVQGAYYNWN